MQEMKAVTGHENEATSVIHEFAAHVHAWSQLAQEVLEELHDRRRAQISSNPPEIAESQACDQPVIERRAFSLEFIAPRIIRAVSSGADRKIVRKITFYLCESFRNLFPNLILG